MKTSQTLLEVSTVGSLYMPNLIGDYECPEKCIEWQWIENNASFKHVGNYDELGVFEFIINVDRFISDDKEECQIADDASDMPEKLIPVILDAAKKRLSYIIFHQ